MATTTLEVEHELETVPDNTHDPPSGLETAAGPREGQEVAIAYPGGTKLALLTVGIVLSIFLVAVDSTVLATATPAITDEFGSIANIAWYATSYGITNTSFKLVWGKAYQIFHLKPTILASIAVFELGNVICALSQSSVQLIVGRIVSGIGGAGTASGAFIILAQSAPPRLRPAYQGVVSATFGCASVLGPLMGGSLTDTLGWRWVFWISLPIGAMAAGMMCFFLSQPAHLQPPMATWTEKLNKLDLGGSLLLTCSISLFVLAMHWLAELTWTDSAVIGSLLAALATAVLFVIYERYLGPKAMLQMHVFRNKIVATNLMYSLLFGGLYWPLLYSLPIQFQAINNQSASRSGVSLIPLVLGISGFTLVVNGALTFMKGYFNPFMVVGANLGTVGVSCMFALAGSAGTASWVGYEILTASGIGLGLQIPLLANQATVLPSDLSAVTSLTIFAENVGTTLFTAMSEAAFTSGLIKGLSQYATDVDAQTVVNVGATQLRQKFSQAQLPGILSAYLLGCKDSYLVCLCCGIAAIAVSLVNAGPSGLRDVKRRMGQASRAEADHST